MKEIQHNFSVQMVLGPHNLVDNQIRTASINLTRRLLEKDPTIAVVFFQEGTSLNPKIAGDMLKATEVGYPPTLARELAVKRYNQMINGEKNSPIEPVNPSIWNEDYVNSRRKATFPPNHSQLSLFEALDALYLASIQNDVSRLLLTFESSNIGPNHLENQRLINERIVRELGIEENDLMRVFSLFKQHCISTASMMSERDKTTTSDIKNLAKKRPNTVVVAPFGGAHSFIGHRLIDNGIPVVMNRVPMVEGKWVIPITPDVIIQRKIQANGRGTITDLEWYQAFFAYAKVLIARDGHTDENLSDAEVIDFLNPIYEEAASFTTVDAIKSAMQNRQW